MNGNRLRSEIKFKAQGRNKMWSDEDQADVNEFKVNKKFAEKFTKQKKAEELDKAKLKYGKNLESIINLLTHNPSRTRQRRRRLRILQWT